MLAEWLTSSSSSISHCWLLSIVPFTTSCRCRCCCCFRRRILLSSSVLLALDSEEAIEPSIFPANASKLASPNAPCALVNATPVSCHGNDEEELATTAKLITIRKVATVILVL